MLSEHGNIGESTVIQINFMFSSGSSSRAANFPELGLRERLRALDIQHQCMGNVACLSRENWRFQRSGEHYRIAYSPAGSCLVDWLHYSSI